MLIRFLLFTILTSFSQLVVAQCPIIPTPSFYQESEGNIKIEKQLSIVSTSLSKNNYDFFKDQLSRMFSIELIDVKRRSIIQFERDGLLTSAYQIEVGETILVKYKTDADAFYAITSLLQMIQTENEKLFIAKCEISDSPKFEWRGLHLDVARHFFTVDEVKRYIDLMSFYKFNKFHWHLTDDQGWRVEIKQYPKLTEVGAYRDSTIVGHYNAEPRTYKVEKYGGYYTQDQIKEVIDYASKRHIEIIPEIELPGHARAAIASYPYLSCTEKLLPVPGLWGVFDDIYCSKPETIQFLKNVLKEVIELFPSEYIHIGGDEAPKTRWETCDKCQKVMHENHLKNEHELQSYFIQQMDDFLTANGKKLIGWDEILEGGLSTNAAVMSWRGEEGGIEAANQKHEVVMSPTSYCYFDYYQSGSASEPLAIGGFLPLEKVYEYNVIPKELEEQFYSYILGGQANLWTEYIETFDHVEYMVYPRALALIQELWSTEKPNYTTFLDGFVQFYEPFLNKLEVNYSRSIYFPELNISRIEDGVKYEFVSMRDSNLYINRTSFMRKSDDIGGSSLFLEPSWTQIRTNIYNDGHYFINVNSDLISVPIQYKFLTHKGLGIPIDLITKPHTKFSNGGDLTLVDGVLGARPWKGDQWLGFDEKLIEMVIDVSKLDTLNSFIIGFLDAKGSWIYLPKSIDISYESEDGEWINFSTIEVREEYQKVDFKVKAKRVKLRVNSIDEIPQGAEGAGQVPWTFIDEIIIK